MYSFKKREELENLEELASLENQVRRAWVQDELGKQNYHGMWKKYLNHLLIQYKKPNENFDWIFIQPQQNTTDFKGQSFRSFEW